MKDDADAMAENGSSEDRISKLEDELKAAVVLEAEAVQRFNSARKRAAALYRELHQARRLMLAEASEARTALFAQTEEILEAARADAEREADQITKQAVDKANEIVASAEREAAATVDARREEVRALEADAIRRIDQLDTEHQELTHKLGALESIYDDLHKTLTSAAETSIEKLAETQESLKQLQNPGQPLAVNKEQTTSDRDPEKERLESAGLNEDPAAQEAGEDTATVTGAAPAEASGEQDQLTPLQEAMPESDDGGSEPAVTIDDRDRTQHRTRHRRWLNRNQDRASEKSGARQDEAISKRFNRILSPQDGFESADAEDVSAADPD